MDESDLKIRYLVFGGYGDRDIEIQRFGNEYQLVRPIMNFRLTRIFSPGRYLINAERFKNLLYHWKVNCELDSNEFENIDLLARYICETPMQTMSSTIERFEFYMKKPKSFMVELLNKKWGKDHFN